MYITDVAPQNGLASAVALCMQTAVGVLSGMAVLCTLLKTVSYKRRIASPLIDMEVQYHHLNH